MIFRYTLTGESNRPMKRKWWFFVTHSRGDPTVLWKGSDDFLLHTHGGIQPTFWMFRYCKFINLTTWRLGYLETVELGNMGYLKLVNCFSDFCHFCQFLAPHNCLKFDGKNISFYITTFHSCDEISKWHLKNITTSRSFKIFQKSKRKSANTSKI